MSPSASGRTQRKERLVEQKTIELKGIFVQIGVASNTEWMKGTTALSPRCELKVRMRPELPGVFAAGDATTVPYK